MRKLGKTALFIGRFQPFHKGHLYALKWISKRHDQVILAIGSAQCKNVSTNPFSFNERKKMISLELVEYNLDKKCQIYPVTDINNDEKWVSHLDFCVPYYEYVYSNNSHVIKLMKKAGKIVKKIPFFSKEKYNATKIRNKIKDGKLYRDTVPKNIFQELNKINAHSRIIHLKRI